MNIIAEESNWQVINLPYRCIKPHIKDLVSVSLQRHLGAPFKVTCDASWFEALFDPTLSNLAGICCPCTWIEIPQEERQYHWIQLLGGCDLVYKI